MGAAALPPSWKLIAAIGAGRRFDTKGLEGKHSPQRQGTNGYEKAIGAEKTCG